MGMAWQTKLHLNGHGHHCALTTFQLAISVRARAASVCRMHAKQYTSVNERTCCPGFPFRSSFFVGLKMRLLPSCLSRIATAGLRGRPLLFLTSGARPCVGCGGPAAFGATLGNAGRCCVGNTAAALLVSTGVARQRACAFASSKKQFCLGAACAVIRHLNDFRSVP